MSCNTLKMFTIEKSGLPNEQKYSYLISLAQNRRLVANYSLENMNRTSFGGI